MSRQPRPASPSHKAASTTEAELGQSIADSIRRAIGKMPLSELTRLDSVLARIGPEIDRATRAQQGRARGIPLPPRHYWLAPNGDSIAARPVPPNAPPEVRSAAAAREIQAHISRMKERFASGDTRGARQEFTMAAGELSILREMDPDPEHTAIMQQELGQALRDLVVTCNRMRADSTLTPGIKCENLLAFPNRFRQQRQPR